MPFPGLMATVADEELIDVTDALIGHLEKSCNDESHDLIAFQPQAEDSTALTCMTITHETSLSACQETAASLRSGDNGEDASLPTLACVPLGKLACEGEQPQN